METNQLVETNPYSSLYNWLFHFNHHTDTWYAFLREDNNKYFNEEKCVHISSKNVSVLVEIIRRAEGDKDKIQDVIY
jgi:hypothetical protein